MSEARIVNVGFACNNEYGGFTDRAKQVDITTSAGTLIQLEPPDFGGSIKFQLGIERREIYVGGNVFGIEGYRAYVGNLTWDAAAMSVDEVARLLALLRAHKWELVEAEMGLCEAYQAGLPLGEPLMRALT